LVYLDAEKADAKKAAAYYDSTANDLTPLAIVVHVRIQDTSTLDKIGEIVAIGSRRNYRMKIADVKRREK